MGVEDRLGKVSARDIVVAKNIDHPNIVAVRISPQRFATIHNRMTGGIVFFHQEGPPVSPIAYVNTAYLLTNSLMPNLLDKVLRETLTPRQYKRVRDVNSAGKIVKFMPIGNRQQKSKP